LRNKFKQFFNFFEKFSFIFKISRWLFYLSLFLLVVNLLFWWFAVDIEEIKVKPKTEIYNKGFLLPIGSVVFVFSHGVWKTDKNLIVRHYTTLNNKDLPTDSLIVVLRGKGVRYIWLSACAAGDYEFMFFDRITRKKISWPDYVSRGAPGDVVPVWLLVWFGRFSIGEPFKIDTTEIKWETVTVALYPLLKPNEKDSLKILTAADKRFIFDKVKEIKKEQAPHEIEYLNNQYKIPIIKISELNIKNSLITSSDLYLKIKNKAVILEAKGWLRGKYFIINIRIEPIIEF